MMKTTAESHPPKTVLVTGGTGSFGEVVTKKILQATPHSVRVFSRDETKQNDLRLKLGSDRVSFYLGDVRDYSSIMRAIEGVDYVFHAAALKQVPSCEFHPQEAVKTNVIGSENLFRCSIEAKVEKVVALSTDKAVYPVNAMGLTKALMEKLMMSNARGNRENGYPVFCATRYGNVMASRGSVIPLFIDQILKGEDLTVTNSDMTRFLMSLDESVDLVFHAFENSRSGDIFVQKAPACTIGNLAEVLVDIFNSSSKINIIGTRHGEKLYETLISREELVRAEDLGLYYRIPVDERDLNYASFFSDGNAEISLANDYTSHNTDRLSYDELYRLLINLPYVKSMLALRKGN